MNISVQIAKLKNYTSKSFQKRNVQNANCYLNVSNGMEVSSEFLKQVKYNTELIGYEIVNKISTKNHCLIYLQKPQLYKVISYNFTTGEITSDTFSDSDMETFGYFRSRKAIGQA